jgi:hypothetical protein
MAKKAVATLQTGNKEKFVKVVKMVKSPKTGAYMFSEEILPQSKADEVLKK